ncbi:hypothetical protein PILCRDRAFT_819844 [Piloderma croceum F 1598]|uniref:Uncharacterized protein n=1 Tax=Piloderma croceum (strain F 1598) TaxID=765440 RepID=A0A0C3C0D1_PILCF|nr:hypothetical protein PILCRDRAFT_819844 [Piloderma croceum F 1598]
MLYVVRILVFPAGRASVGHKHPRKLWLCSSHRIECHRPFVRQLFPNFRAKQAVGYYTALNATIPTPAYQTVLSRFLTSYSPRIRTRNLIL